MALSTAIHAFPVFLWSCGRQSRCSVRGNRSSLEDHIAETVYRCAATPQGCDHPLTQMQDILIQNYLEGANLQYYPVFPEQLRGQSAKWWESRAAGNKLSPELTCLLLRVCALSTQYLEASLLQRLEAELGEKAQTMTDRFHTAAQKLSSSISQGKGGIVNVQQLFLAAQWYKGEACMVESWHALSVAVREAQEISTSPRGSNHSWWCLEQLLLGWL